ncbi:MAG TPA: hypothetical protein VLM40_07360 [Gemmata sp.]|nr:hypothetical protein [Gemmata sp.]
MSVRFAGGFPEEVEFVNLDEPEHAPKLVHRWAAAMPVVRVVFVHPLTLSEWKRVDGPHFSRVPEFVFHHLPAETTVRVAASPHLANLAWLSICPIGPVTDAIRAVVHSPSWTRLRTLRVTTILSPAGMQELARQCNLNKLEDLELTVGNAADPFASLGAIGEILSHVIHLVASSLTVRPVGGLNWPEYGPAFETFAATKWVRKLRRLRIASSRGIGTLAIPLFNRPPRRAPDADFLPDRALLALSDSLNRKRLEKLLLPLSVVSAEVRGRLSRRFGSRVEFE